MKVSVIVPIYNVEKYLDRCISSIVNQSYKELEIILVDDGSTDGSTEIIDSYAKQDDRIVVIHKVHTGVSDARNAGIDRAGGECICFVDSDDSVHKEYVAVLAALMEEYQCDIVQCAFNRDSKEQELLRKQTTGIEAYSNLEMLNNIYSAMSVEIVVVWNKLYKRELFSNVRFPQGMIHEDEAVIYQLLYKAKRIVRTDEILYFYYPNSNGIMKSGYTLKHLDILKALEMRMSFYAQHDLNSLYQKDSYKYLCKILIQYYQVSRFIDDNKEVLKELKRKYWNKYRECRSFPWSRKRKSGLFFFGCFPKWYVPMMRKDNY